MKKWFVILSLVLLLSACGSDEADKTSTNADPEAAKSEKTEQAESTEPSQEDLNESLKDEAVAANFVELNSDEAEVGLKVHATGEISNIQEDGIFRTFTLTTDENDGTGMYSIKDLLKEEEYTEGDIVKVYGIYDGKDEVGFPVISSTVIEK
ncbi:hypothetical protein CHH80_03370 [Bacillus sp. 7504-2]|nr:hypothetical protein CHH80_03370 [Bacillus sp. 7504-2]